MCTLITQSCQLWYFSNLDLCQIGEQVIYLSMFFRSFVAGSNLFWSFLASSSFLFPPLYLRYKPSSAVLSFYILAAWPIELHQYLVFCRLQFLVSTSHLAIWRIDRKFAVISLNGTTHSFGLGAANCSLFHSWSPSSSCWIAHVDLTNAFQVTLL